jgi:hypothetical protein
MIFTFHNTVEWWHYIGKNLGFDFSVVVTDIRGEGDFSIVDDFYRELKYQLERDAPASNLLSSDQVRDVIGRCRMLRWLDRGLALAMVHAMAEVLDRVLARIAPDVIISFPIDRYVMDVLERRASARNIPYLELTTSPFSGMSMFLRRGRLVERNVVIDERVFERRKQELISPDFVPAYLPNSFDFSVWKCLRTIIYLKTRAVAFKVLGRLKRDPLNAHYMDAQGFLGHKPRISDISVTRLVNKNWQRRLDDFSRDKRVFFGLQLFPEASIDYWIDNFELVQHEDCVFDAAKAFSDSGYLVLIKDHPLQFGFRQKDLIERLLALRNTVFVPYEIGGQSLLHKAGVNFTFTGTLGLQAALGGLKSLVTQCYYSNDCDFVVFNSRKEIPVLPARVESHQFESPLEERQTRIVGKLLRASFEGNYLSFWDYRRRGSSADALALAQSIGSVLRGLIGPKYQ